MTLLFLAVFLFSARGSAQEPPQTPLLVIISVDGMRPDYVTAADEHGAKIPNLRRFLKEGSYAQGVEGVVPTVTYPSHTTLVTGVWPAKHGILGNTVFDPLQKNHEGWYWYAEDIRVPTLWDAAARVGRTTASVQWPVTVGAHITWNIPEFWRASTEDDAKLLRAVSTTGLLAEADKEIGAYAGGIDASIEADERRGKYAEWMRERKYPALLTLHLIALDHIEHDTGPFSPEAITMVDEKGKIADWRAMPWVHSASAAIMLKNPGDMATLNQVRELLAKLARDPANGIDRILDAEDLHKRGGFPDAAFFVSPKPGWKMGTTLEGPILSKTKPGGTHGELPDLPDLRAAFFVIGPGVPAARSFGIIDMRDVAPTLAHLTGLSLPSADGKNLLP